MNQEAYKKFTQAKINLMLNQPFFGHLAPKLILVEDDTQPTAWTDGTRLGYNPEFILSLTVPEVAGTICHEVLHCACGHPWRRETRDLEVANAAMDYAINLLILESGLQLPKGVLVDEKYSGMAFETIYPLLPKDKFKGKGCGIGEVRDGQQGQQPGSGEKTLSEFDWISAVEQAVMIARLAGQCSANMERLAGFARQPVVNWPAYIQQWFTEKVKDDYSYTRANRKYLPQGIYMPSLTSEALGCIVCSIDTSGSVDADLLATFNAEVQSAVDQCRPEKVYVIYCDAKVNHVDVFERGEQIVFKPYGGGGTDFSPVFDYIQTEGIEPVCMVYFTDLVGSFPSDIPDYPTLWAVYGGEKDAPFGEVIPVY